MTGLEKILLTERFGKINPLSLDDFLAHEGYAGLRKALEMTREQVIGAVKASELRGRGGAAFPVGVKMEAVFQSDGPEKYIVCNADEGEPGNFKDRYLMENDPHQILEGMIICAYAVGARKGYVFIRGEYTRAAYVMETAIRAARQAGYAGENILGSGFDFDMEVYSGAGSYVCGEEFALMTSIEGNPARSTYKPPFPTTEGLYNRPTQINNVESFANIPRIVKDGSEAFRQIGTASSKGTKLVSLSGNVRRRGLYEVPFGITLRDIIEGLGGGIPQGRGLCMVQLGGASGPCLPEKMLDLRLDYREMASRGLSFGSGAVIVMDDRTDILHTVMRTLEFFHHESCGKCTPCREGIGHLMILLERFILSVATPKDMENMRALIDTIQDTSICGLGQAAPTALRTTLEYFPEVYASRLKEAESASSRRGTWTA